ncbi:TonB family protein [Rufibacter glacialis]|uniref:TonB family protein n=1 Tax=Rufibacter glacialis TaxID=1259555 RepID=A0A5M8QIM4_9BACT|nr:energy transducer TonB [Rufibacter glacialis]KAA6434636.1 TonB family protein [Rufibacter glacialis]GGK71249.1 hypothetical protein GCM10011405_19240 [Rufibacter glacialis]
MKKFLLFSFLAFSSLAALSQPDPEYLDQYYRTIKNKQEAVYYRFTTYSGAKKEKRHLTTHYLTGEKYYEEEAVKEAKGKYRKEGPTRYFYKNGQVKEEQLFTGHEVQLTKWHENGQVYYKGLKVNGKLEGEALGFYPSGQLRRREQFTKGELTTGECYAENGSMVPYYPHFTQPEFPGGTSILMKLITSSFRMPREAARSEASGVTVVQFIVSEKGAVHEARILQSIHPDIDDEALRVVNSLPNFSPATEEGQPKEFSYSVPIKVKTRVVTQPDTQRPKTRPGMR